MIDLHCHIHPGVDDGPFDADDSRALAKALVAVGVDTVAATSHVRPDKGWMNTKKDDAARRAHLAEVLEGIPLRVVSGAEHYMDGPVFGNGVNAFADLAVTYGDSHYVLVETPYLGEPPNLLELLHALRVKGFRVLLAHVERFPYLSDKVEFAQRLVDAGVLLQVNLGSLAGAYNRAQQKNAERMLKEGLVAVLAGDCHREDDVERNIVAGKKAALKIVDEAALEKLITTNPRLILEDAAPNRVWP